MQNDKAKLKINTLKKPSLGFEPRTYSLQNCCSAIELGRRNGWGRIRTCEGIKPSDLQSDAFGRFATHPKAQARA